MPTQRKNLIEDMPISLAFVLKNGNNAGTNLINMNNNNITQIGELQAVGNGFTNTITSQNMLIQSDSLQSAAIELSDNGADMYVEDVSGNYVSLATTNSLTENSPTVEIVDATHNKHLILTSQKLYLGSSTNYETPPANKILGTDASGNLKYKCQIIGDGTVATLSEVLDSGNIAGQSIDMSNNNITNVGELQSENSMFESIFSVDKISINNKTTEQELLVQTIYDGACVSVKDLTSNYAKLETTSYELLAPFNVPSLQLQDNTNDSQLRLTAQKLYLGSSTNYETPPVNQLLGTDASGNLKYKTQSVATLSEVLDSGHTAGQSIDMSNNNITNVGELQSSNSTIESIFSVDKISITNKTTDQELLAQPVFDGACVSVKDSTSSYAKLESTSDELVAPFNVPSLHLRDTTNDTQIRLTSQKLYLGSSSIYQLPPANKLLGTDASGNLKYKTQSVATLSEVLDSGHTASQSIDMNNNNITNVGELQSENPMFESIFSSNKFSINNKSTVQELLAQPVSDGASVYVKDSTSSYAKLESTSDSLLAPFNVPSLQLRDTTNDSQIRITAQKLYLGSSSSYETPPVNQVLGTDASGNLKYKNQSVATLSEVLDSGHTAGQSIDMSNNNITKVGELQSENPMFESIFSSNKFSITNKTTDQELLAQPVSDGACVSVKDSTSSYAKLESTSDSLLAPFNIPSLQLRDTTNDSQIRLTAQKLYLGSSSSYETPPVNQVLGTDASGNLTYKNQSVSTLSEVLDSGHTAGQSIDMSNNNITNIGELQFASAPVSTPVLNQSGTALKIQMNGQDYYIQIYTVPP